MTQALVETSPATSVALGEEVLEREVSDFMTPGCLTVSDDATVEQAAAALAAHRVHAILVVGATKGTPLGWVTARGLLGWLGRDRSLASAREAITERVTAIDPDETVRVAVYALSTAGTSRLLVRRHPHQLPLGVVTDFDLAVAAGR
jgi:CBS domain-containing protein